MSNLLRPWQWRFRLIRRDGKVRGVAYNISHVGGWRFWRKVMWSKIAATETV